jgi:hypothetical protein
MIVPSKVPLFELGQVVATTAALTHMKTLRVEPIRLLWRHVHGDWGDVTAHDWNANERALKDGSRIFSSYMLTDGTKIWIITEAMFEGKRGSTCLLLPDDY